MSKHTPGPWHWEFTEGPLDPPQLEGNVKYSDQNPILVTHGCSPSCMRKHGRPCPLVPSKEDMALIAAAPQLLEATALLAIPYEGLLADSESRRWIAPALWAAIEEGVKATRAAIAAAEGRA